MNARRSHASSRERLAGSRWLSLALPPAALAAKAGSFTTPTPVADAVLRQGRARPRVVSRDQVSTLIVKVLSNNRPVGGAPVRFEVLPGSRGDGTFDGAASAEVLRAAGCRAGGGRGTRGRR